MERTLDMLRQWLTRFTRKRFSAFMLAIVFVLSVGIAPVRSQININNQIIHSRLKEVEDLKNSGNYFRACQELLGALHLSSNLCDIDERLDNTKLTKISEGIKDYQNPLIQTSILWQLGNVMSKIGKLDEAKYFLTQSLRISKNTPLEIQSTVLLELGNVFRAYGKRISNLEFTSKKDGDRVTAVCSNLKNLEKKEDFYSESLSCYEQAAKISASSNTTSWIFSQLNIINLVVEQDGAETIFKQYRRDLPKLIKSIENLPHNKQRQIVNSAINLSSSLLKYQQKFGKEMPPSIDEIGKKILSVGKDIFRCIDPSSLKSSDLESSLWGNIIYLLDVAYTHANCSSDDSLKASALEKVGYFYFVISTKNNSTYKTQLLQEARKITQSALSIAQPANLPQNSYQIQAQLADILEDLGKTDEAISNYKSAINTLKAVRKDLLLTDSDIQFSFRDDVEPIYRKLVSLLLKNENVSQDNLNDARLFLQLLRQAELESLLRCQFQGSGQQIALDALIDRKKVEEDPKSQEALIYPVLLSDRIEVILKLPGEKKLYHPKPTMISSLDSEAILSNLRKSIAVPERSADARKKSHQVYNWLIQPIQTKLESYGVDTLVFLLDLPFRNIPLSSLYTDGENKGEYLIEKYAIAVTSGLKIETSKQGVGQFSTILGDLTQSRQGYKPLKNLDKQFNAIKAHMPVERLNNDQFTSEKLGDRMMTSPSQIIHLATHGEFSSQPGKTFILTWDEKVSVNKLRKILTQRLQGNPQPIELLVLAACETVKGDKRAALGLAGVAVRSGARSTLATLWKVSADDSSSYFFNQFYQSIATQRLTKAKAVQSAQVKMIKSDNPDFNRPYFWAPYVLIENWL